MKVLVTGASGYAGGAVAARLRAAGHDVLTAGRHAQDDIAMDLLNASSVRQLALSRGIGACVHSAAMHEVQCRENPVQAYAANVTATRALIAACMDAGVGSFVYVSTFHVFGAPQGVLTEDAQPSPRTDYGLSHRLAEEVVLMCHPGGRVLRPSNLYGVPADWSQFRRWTLAPFDFAQQAATSGRIKLVSDGSPLRNYVSLDSFAAAVLAALQSDWPRLTHIAGRRWSMLELAKLAAQAAQQVTGSAATVQTGSVGSVEQAWEFSSRTFPLEADADGANMSAFLTAAVQHARSLA